MIIIYDHHTFIVQATDKQYHVKMQRSGILGWKDHILVLIPPKLLYFIEYTAHFFYWKWCWKIVCTLYLEGSIHEPYS